VSSKKIVPTGLESGELRRAAGFRDRFGSDSHLLLPMFAAANGIGYLPLLTVPWLIGGLVRDRGYSDSVAGMIASSEIGLLAATTLVVGIVVHRFSRRIISVLGACVALLGSAALMLFSRPWSMIALLATIGVGCGMCSAAGNSLLSSAKDPARLTARMWALAVLWQTLVWFVTPLVVGKWHSTGLYALLAVGCAIYLPMIMMMPDRKLAVRADQQTATCARTLRLATILPIVLCTFAFWLRDSVTWSLAERRGQLLGVSDYHLGLTFTAASVLGLIGPIAANNIGMRFGRLKTVLGGLLLIGLVLQVIASATSPMAYQAGFLLWTCASIFSWTYVMEMAAAVDPKGRVAATCGGIVFVTAACGPILGGAILDWGGRATLPSAILMLTTITLLSAYYSARRL
jgi:MFS family permease